MKKINKLAVSLMALIAAAGANGAMDTSTLTGSTRNLDGGRIYRVTDNVNISVGNGESALTASPAGEGDGKIVVIDIAEGKTLTVKGSDASGTTGAGAGIELPSGMTLYITGRGKLVATGGNAANGGNGGDGRDAYQQQEENEKFWNGRGGRGGDGGGGAGAGIGGKGGNGSVGGDGPNFEIRNANAKGFATDGANGWSASGGSDGMAGGNVVILGDVAVTVKGGSKGAGGSASTSRGDVKWDLFDNDHWFAGGGGPGGAGGGGGAADAIGGGGGGGGGGGAGGTGSFVHVDDWDDPGNNNLLDSNGNMDKASICGANGGSGSGATNRDGSASGGGSSSNPGRGGTRKNYDSDRDESKAGDGGSGCNGHTQGGGGGLYAMPSVGLASSPHRDCDNINSMPQTTFHSVTVTLDLGLKNSSGGNVTTSFPLPFAKRMEPIVDIELNGVNPRIARPGYRFAGYWTAREGGTCVYGPDYKPTTILSPYTQDITLYARWEIDASVLSVTSSGDAASALDVYGNTAITLRDAVQALIDNPTLVGTDGRRRVTFEKLDATNRVIRLASEIAVESGVRSFEINGLCELEPGQKGVEIVAGPNARHLYFKGKSSDGGAFSLASLTFTGMNASFSWHGGAISINGEAAVSVDSCAFHGNRMNGDYNGAAIAVMYGGAELYVTSSTFAGNRANHHAGAVYVHGSYALFANTTFSDNTAGSLGGAVLEDGGGKIDLLNCTFAKNTANAGRSIYSANGNAAIRAVNCIFADSGAVSMHGGVFSNYWSSVDVDPSKVFTSHGAAITQVVAGVTHVIHPPLGGASAGNEDAAEIYHDPTYKNILAVGRDGREVLLDGSRELAKIPFVVDQVAAVRTAPTRGAIRLAVGTEPVTVELDGVLYDEGGSPKSNQVFNTVVTVSYSDGATTTNLVVRTAEEGVFGLSVPVDGSDGLSHNVTAIQVDALGQDPIAVTMAPYALTAASVEVLASDEYLPLYGDAIAIGNVIAQSISVTNSFDARSASSFTAGALKGFGDIDMENISISGGSLDWLGGASPASGVEFANLDDMTVGGGADVDNAGTVSGDAAWKAANDGFFQLQARCLKPKDTKLKLDVVDESNSVVAEVTPEGTLGNADGTRRFVWTIPVRSGDTVRLTMSAGEISSAKAQFIYFGVAE